MPERSAADPACGQCGHVGMGREAIPRFGRFLQVVGWVLVAGSLCVGGRAATDFVDWALSIAVMLAVGLLFASRRRVWLCPQCGCFFERFEPLW